METFLSKDIILFFLPPIGCPFLPWDRLPLLRLFMGTLACVTSLFWLKNVSVGWVGIDGLVVWEEGC